MMRKGTYENPPKKKKKKKPKGPKHPECLCCGIVVQKQQGAKPPCFLSYNLPNLGRLGLVGARRKHSDPTSFSFLPPLPTKYPFQPFSLSLSPPQNHLNQTYQKRKIEHFLLFSSHFLIFVTYLS